MSSVYEGMSQSIPKRAWNDCTNFVSQALAAGRLEQNNNWQYKDGLLSKPTHSWGGAANFHEIFKNRFGYASTSNATVGDVAQIIYVNAERPFHTLIITKDSGPNITDKYLTYHTKDKRNINANTLFNKFGESVYIYFYHIN